MLLLTSEPTAIAAPSCVEMNRKRNVRMKYLSEKEERHSQKITNLHNLLHSLPRNPAHHYRGLHRNHFVC